MRNGAQFTQQEFEFVVAEEQGITAAQQHIADDRGLTDVGDLLREIRVKIIAGGIAHETRSRAVTTVSRATIGHQKQDAIRVPMHQPWNGRVRILAARIRHFPWRGMRLFQARDHLPANRAVLIR